MSVMCRRRVSCVVVPPRSEWFFQDSDLKGDSQIPQSTLVASTLQRLPKSLRRPRAFRKRQTAGSWNHHSGWLEYFRRGYGMAGVLFPEGGHASN